MTTPTLAAIVLTSLLLLAGCNGTRADGRAAGGDDAPSTRPAATQPTTLTGTLQGGMMAIGGETSGWVLVGEGETGGMDLDVAAVEQRARELDGRRVKVIGRMTSKDYVERGRTPVLVVERIEAAPEE